VVTCISIAIPLIAIVAASVAAARDLLTGASRGATLKRWLRYASDAFFSIP
jgi:hypothetical protein